MEPLDPDDPERVGRYRLLRRLGVGGMGVVYLAGSWTGRKVAVKVIHDHLLTDAESRARFAREIRAAQTVSGPFTARLLHAEPTAEPPWLATEYLPGVPLQTAIESFEDGMPVATVRALAVGIAEALATIHRRGVVHRDLTPRNIMLTDGGPRVIDFGISRIAGHVPVTRPDRRFGSPAYMSPENRRGAAANPTDDVFSLGAVLAFAVTGIPPSVTGLTTARWALDELDDPDLSEVIGQCLRTEPRRRPSAEEVVNRLGRAGVALHGTGWLPESVAALIGFRVARSREVADAPVRRGTTDGVAVDGTTGATVTGTRDDAAAPDAPGPRLVGDPALTRRRLLIGGAALSATATGGALVWFNRPSAPAPSTDVTPSTAAPVGSPPPSPRREWQTRIGNSSSTLGIAAKMLLAITPDDLVGVDPGTGEVKWKHRADSAAISGDHGYFMYNQDYPQRLRAVDPASGEIAWSRQPDSLLWSVTSVAGKTYVVTDRVRAVDAGTGSTLWSANVEAAEDTALSLNATEDLVVVHGVAIVGLDPADGRSRWEFSPDAGDARRVFPVLGGGLVYVFDEEFTLHALDARDGRVAWTFDRLPVVYPPRYRDRRLFVPDVDGMIVAVDTETGKQVWDRRIGHGEGAAYGYSNVINIHGDTLYVGGTDGTVYGLDAADGSILWTHEAEVSHTFAPVFADGLVFISLADGGLRALKEPGDA